MAHPVYVNFSATTVKIFKQIFYFNEIEIKNYLLKKNKKKTKLVIVFELYLLFIKHNITHIVFLITKFHNIITEKYL